ncbi:hypothetical protein [Capnocytophaga gingivalis]|uniref:Outer membrane protein beta-barrel domain-containing protein n=1 Tax=Capnocytophaga gingivalis TaxID=1017 RepID=A0ABU5Z5G3_9FLAO|nr:hypothetical protein [Capnocytophaga gingivalis]MEB3074160.1 hypothetical protein [Capnocytophaga gingivalis]
MRKYIFILFLTHIALAQEGNVSFNQVDSLSTSPVYRHQIGIGISRFVNSAFPSDTNTFLLEYCYLKDAILSYRIGGDYRAESNKDSTYEIALKVGIDKLFRDYKRWKFYYGVDLWSRYLYYENRKQHFTSIALNPFLGIQYQLSSNFSISTEPGFFIKYNFRRDYKSFDPEAQAHWWESRFAKIGNLQINFHF